MVSPFSKAQISFKRYYYYRTEISYLESKIAGSYDLWGPCQVLIVCQIILQDGLGPPRQPRG